MKATYYNLDCCYHEKCCKNSVTEAMETGVVVIETVKVMETAEARKKITRTSKYTLPERCIIIGRGSSWFTKDKVTLNP